VSETLRLKVEPVGECYTTRNESDIAELMLGIAGLRVIVSTTGPEGNNPVLLEFTFSAVRGFRYLGEGDLIRYWESRAFPHGFHLYKIHAGGWRDQELATHGMLSVAGSDENVIEWFVGTTNGCLNVLSPFPPQIREL
jgi:hypothetical protein